MDIEIGSDVFRNSDGTIEIEGLPQIEIALKSPSGPVLVTFIVPDENGRVLAKVVNSGLVFNEAGLYAVSKGPTSFTMTKVQSSTVVLHIELREPDRVAIRQAELTTLKGHLFQVTPVEWRIGETRSRGAESDQKGGPVMIG